MRSVTPSTPAARLTCLRPAFNETRTSRNLVIANYVFLGMFTLEACFKILAMGLVMHKGAYLRDGWVRCGGCSAYRGQTVPWEV